MLYLETQLPPTLTHTNSHMRSHTVKFPGLSVVLQVGLFLGLHLQNTLHVVFVVQLGGPTAQSDHALRTQHTRF